MTSDNQAPTCDFCRRPVIVWDYPCNDFIVPEFKWISVGDWAACDNCADYIERGKLDDLAFLISGLEVKASGQKLTFEGELQHGAIYRGLKHLYKLFDLNRKGTRILA